MTGILKHVFLLFVLAAVCYVIAILFTDDRLGFILFFVAGLFAELVFWLLFWRERRDRRHTQAGTKSIA